MLLPNFLKPYSTLAKALLKQDVVKDLEFSGGTYQILIVDPISQQEIWTFLQLDTEGKLQDSFCSCTEGSHSQEGCVHQTIAFISIYGEFSLPLHERFSRSLWNHLCKIFSSYIEFPAEQLKETSNGYEYRTEANTVLFAINPKTEHALLLLRKILFSRQKETEETSLKFSKLTEEEILLWRKGRPSPELRYELSFWSDLAKWLLISQEKTECSVSFKYNDQGLPNYIEGDFSDLNTLWDIEREDLVLIIPALATVKSPLPIFYPLEEKIEKILYHQDKRCLEFIAKKNVKPLPLEGVNLEGKWMFVPHKGFYSLETQSPLPEMVWETDIGKILDEHFPLIRKFLVNAKIYNFLTPVTYTLYFDSSWNLRIDSYLFEPGDLTFKKSTLFGSWAYLDGDGFYPLEDRYFEETQMTVERKEISEFVSLHRAWFNTQEGMRIHLSSLQSNISYKVTEEKNLQFFRSFSEELRYGQDFGQWIYIKNQGFFSKTALSLSLPIKDGTTIGKEQVPYFIQENREELQLIPYFFCLENPVEEIELKVSFFEEELLISPEYKIKKEYQFLRICFFDSLIYIEGKGFYNLPKAMLPPPKFCHEQHVDKKDLAQFINQELPQLTPYIKNLDPRLEKAKGLTLEVSHASFQKDLGNYTLELNYKNEHGNLSLNSIWQALENDQHFLLTDLGVVDLADKNFHWLKLLKPKSINHKSGMVTFSPQEILRLNAYQNLNTPLETQSTLLKDLLEFKVPDFPNLTHLRGVLRPYQEIGVQWLWFLYSHNLSGLLCDDMGLGKTHQAMALLTAIHNHLKETKAHYLIICPTSVIYHWQEKLEAFLPALRIGVYYGSKRKIERFYEECDVLLTSYGIWRNEAQELSKLAFEVAIFDEMQIAKNHSSRIYKSLARVKAKMKIGLSGTPIENRLRELKALFDLILPAYFPPEQEYKNFFVKPIEKEKNKERGLILTRLVKPFVLRRKKEDVLIELPEKIEQIAYCDLSAEQYGLYTKVLASSREHLLQQLHDEQAPIPYLHIFTLLSHLKQICNHPAAYLKQPLEYKQHQSGKWNLFTELLSEARASQQKVVVFSQYLSMLDIIEAYLEELGIGFAAIRGSTTNRGKELSRFKNDSQCEVFVGSLQAAGLGIDLTAASVVIHYDRWWNAARENQATDRVYRIGQTRGVQVFKLMTKHTLEEHIHNMIVKKSTLMDIIGVDDHQVIKQIERDELVELLRMLPLDGNGLSGAAE